MMFPPKDVSLSPVVPEIIHFQETVLYTSVCSTEPSQSSIIQTSESSIKTASSSANISDTTGLTDTFFGVTIEKMQPYILPVDEVSRFTDFGFINCDVLKILNLNQYLANDWRYRHLIQANYSSDAALYLTQR